MIFAANFKTNHTRKSTLEYLNILQDFLSQNGKKAYIFPPATALCPSTSNVTVGAQNGYFTKNGSFTGEIGLEQLNEFDINCILIGHSERRHILKESQELIAQKFQFYKDCGFEIIYCVGEPLEVYRSGLSDTLAYIKEQLVGIDLEYERLIIAYEPVWAIGTGVSATISDIRHVHTALKNFISRPILYGGSVKVENAKDILSQDFVDGVLVGTASWDVENFKKIISAI